jgi:hypothetical protein
MVKIISYRYGICFGQNYELKQYWNVFWSKFYHATCLERDVVKMASVRFGGANHDFFRKLKFSSGNQLV